MKLLIILVATLLSASCMEDNEAANSDSTAEKSNIDDAAAKKADNESQVVKIADRIAVMKEAGALEQVNEAFFSGYQSERHALKALTSAFSLKSSNKLTVSKGAIEGTADNMNVNVNIEKGIFNITSASKKYEILRPINNVDAEDVMTRQAAFDAAISTLTQLELNDVESGVVAELGMQAKEIDGEPEAPMAVERKVFFERTIAGTPVLNNGMIVSYDLSGKLRSLTGQWTPVAAISKVESSVSTADLRHRIANKLVQMNSRLVQEGSKIDIHAVYVVDDSAGTSETGGVTLKQGWIAETGINFDSENATKLSELVFL